jgi:hypothetical protein
MMRTNTVMAAPGHLVPGCPGHRRFVTAVHAVKTWMSGTRPGMTVKAYGSPGLNGSSLPGGTLASVTASTIATVT